jgi:hypothetical protein
MTKFNAETELALVMMKASAQRLAYHCYLLRRTRREVSEFMEAREVLQGRKPFIWKPSNQYQIDMLVKDYGAFTDEVKFSIKGHIQTRLGKGRNIARSLKLRVR